MDKCQSCHTNIQECDKCIGHNYYNPNKDRLKKSRKNRRESEDVDRVQE